MKKSVALVATAATACALIAAPAHAADAPRPNVFGSFDLQEVVEKGQLTSPMLDADYWGVTTPEQVETCWKELGSPQTTEGYPPKCPLEPYTKDDIALVNFAKIFHAPDVTARNVGIAVAVLVALIAGGAAAVNCVPGLRQ